MSSTATEQSPTQPADQNGQTTPTGATPATVFGQTGQPNQQPTAGQQTGQQSGQQPGAQPNGDVGDGDDDSYTGKGSKAAILADLRSARDKNTALEGRLDQLTNGFKQALGLGKAEKATPEQIAEQLAASQTEAKTWQTQLAVFRAAPAGVDANALLDSASFLTTLGGIDPGDAQAVQAAITAAVEANPRFRSGTTTAPPPGVRDAAAGGTTPAGTKSMDDLIRGR